MPTMKRMKPEEASMLNRIITCKACGNALTPSGHNGRYRTTQKYCSLKCARACQPIVHRPIADRFRKRVALEQAGFITPCWRWTGGLRRILAKRSSGRCPREDAMMRRGWWPYWWNVLMRSWKDAGKFASVIGISLPKLIWGFVAILIVFVGGAVIFEQTNTEKLWWAAGTFGTGLIALLVFFVPCLTRAPWQIENEIVEQHTKEKASWEAKISGLSSELAEIRKILEARDQREAEARNKVRRNS